VVAIRDGVPISLENLSAKIILALNKRSSGLTGSQLAQELGVTPAAVTKTGAELVSLGILRKEPVPVARNVKLYFLAVTVVDEEDVKRLRQELPPVLLEILGKRFGENDALATVYVGQLLEFVRSLPQSEKVMERLLQRVVGTENAKVARSKD
jgi:DNA-binding MarR family transcriptional regulator